MNETIKSKLLDFIKSEFAPFIREDRILSASYFLHGGPGEGFPLDDLLSQLLKIAIDRGIEGAVSDFERGTKETHGSFQTIALLEGIKLEAEIQVFDGIRLVPLPNSTRELPRFLSNISLLDRSASFFISKMLLIADCFVSPIFHKPFGPITFQEHYKQEKRTLQVGINSKDFLNPKVNDFSLNYLCQALSLVCNSAVQTSLVTRFLAEDKLYNLNFSSGGGASVSPGPFGHTANTRQAQIGETKRLYSILANPNSGTLEKLRIPIDRWIKSKTPGSPEDKMIDLGIAFESLYLADRDGNSELSFQFRLRASWHLGKDKADREMLIDEFKAIYTLRSKAVHNGEVPKRIKIRKGESVPTSEFIPRAQDLCRRSIIKILEDGKFPDWNNLILG